MSCFFFLFFSSFLSPFNFLFLFAAEQFSTGKNSKSKQFCSDYFILKVQEIPEEWLEESGVLAGPVLHITCSSAIQLLEPAEITLPMSLSANEEQYVDFSTRDIVVSANSDDGTTGWKDITKELPRPPELNDRVVTFQVRHFTRCVKRFQFAITNGHYLSKQNERVFKNNMTICGFFICLKESEKALMSLIGTPNLKNKELTLT